MEHAHRFPGFFKVYLQSMSSKSLQIPSAFVELLKRVIPKRLILINSEGRSWRVNVDRVGKNMFFMSEGWPEFVSDISLQDGEFLVFDYDGKITLNFMHFGHSTCEQKVVQSLNSEVKVHHSTMNHVKNVKDDDRIEENDNDESEEHDDDDDDNTDKEEEDGDNDDDEDEEDFEAEAEAEAEAENDETGHDIMEGLDYEIQEASIEEDQKEKEKEGSSATSSGSETLEFENEETIFDHGIVKRPKNPYFVTRLRLKRRNELHIPTDMMRDYKIKLVSPMMLLDQEGRKIYTKVRTWKDGRTWLTRGWKTFVKTNNMTEKDMCLCEFVMNGNEPSKVYLNMTVLPAGSWLP